MNVSRWLLLAPVAIVATAAPARADQRATLADHYNKASTAANALAQAAKGSDDRGARKKFGPAAADLADDLGAVARRLGKDVPIKSISKDAAAAEKDAHALVELADEAEDKDTRKTLRSNAQLLAQAVSAARKAIDAAGASEDKPAEPIRFSGQIINDSDACSWAENLIFIVTRNGNQIYKSGLVFPGRQQNLVLDKGTYFIQFTDTSGKLMGQKNLDANKDGWAFKSGCVNQD